MIKTKQKSIQELSHLQHQPSQIKNICILAHVDHGKTTLADCLVASNGIISRRNAGKIRYMDSRPDEQERGITMKSSAITLVYDKLNPESSVEHFLINLIDSPGHVDFSSEVSTAVRLCDGAIVVVDVVEGVCPQTHAVLRQAWLEDIRPVLVLNKVDRLISELKMSAMEAYYHLITLLEQVNLVTNRLFISEAMEKISKDTETSSEEKAESDANTYDWTVIEDEEEYRNIYFLPELGNVIFASAYDGWGFGVQDFARMYSQKLGMKKEVLLKTLWGDYYMNMKAKRIMKGAQAKGKKPLFVHLALENIWAAYDAIMVQKDSTMTEKIVKSLGLTIGPRDTRHKDPRVLLQAVMTQWLPLPEAVLNMVVTHVPSPLAMSEERVETLMCSQNRRLSSLPQSTQALKADFLACKAGDDAPIIIFVSKMFAMDKKSLPQNKARPLTEEELVKRREAARTRHAELKARLEKKAEEEEGKSEKENRKIETVPAAPTYVEEIKTEEEDNPDEPVFIAFARIFSGTVRKGQSVYFLGPKHDPSKALAELSSNPDALPPHVTSVEIKDLYLLMGRELEAVDEVPAGNVLGLGGLEHVILKSGTLSSTMACPAFTDMYFDAAPIVRVAVESANATDMSKLVSGLHLLNQADPCVEVRVQETGEHVIIAAGEVHLQRCIDDLRERYARVEVNVSKPIVPFRETVIEPPTVDMVNENIDEQNQGEEEDEDDGSIQASTADRQCHLMLRAAPLPGLIPDLLLEHQAQLKALHSITSASDKPEDFTESELSVKKSTLEALITLKQKIKEEFDKAGEEWAGAENRIWSFGPRKCGPNILLNSIKGYNRPSVWDPIEKDKAGGKVAEFDNSIVSGFQMATLAGPVCEEPMHGVCFIVEDWWYGARVKPKLEPDMKVGKSDSSSNFKENRSDKGKEMLSIIDMNRKSIDKELHNNKEATCESQKDSEKSRIVDMYSAEGFVQKQSSVFGPLSGQLISTMKEGCRRAFQAQPQRLMVAMYKCEVQATTEVLGKMHGVLSKRFGQVLSEEMQEGTDTFTIVAALPVVESFGFAEDIRKKTSGLASPQLKFSHWEVLQLDPYWVPSTEEEYMHFGEKADAENRARVYMNKVRKRKGLKTDEKIVEFAEKQRTLTKNK